MTTTQLGRQLDIEALNNAKNKVTLGFKCDAQVKLELALEAEEKGVSLSQFIETLVLQRKEEKYTQEELDRITNELNDEIVFYEHPKLYQALKLYHGRIITYTNEMGQQVTITVNDIRDVFTIFINHIQLT